MFCNKHVPPSYDRLLSVGHVALMKEASLCGEEAIMPSLTAERRDRFRDLKLSIHEPQSHRHLLHHHHRQGHLHNRDKPGVNRAKSGHVAGVLVIG